MRFIYIYIYICVYIYIYIFVCVPAYVHIYIHMHVYQLLSLECIERCLRCPHRGPHVDGQGGLLSAGWGLSAQWPVSAKRARIIGTDGVERSLKGVF